MGCYCLCPGHPNIAAPRSISLSGFSTLSLPAILVSSVQVSKSQLWPSGGTCLARFWNCSLPYDLSSLVNIEKLLIFNLFSLFLLYEHEWELLGSLCQRWNRMYSLYIISVRSNLRGLFFSTDSEYSLSWLMSHRLLGEKGSMFVIIGWSVLYMLVRFFGSLSCSVLLYLCWEASSLVAESKNVEVPTLIVSLSISPFSAITS